MRNLILAESLESYGDENITSKEIVYYEKDDMVKFKVEFPNGEFKQITVQNGGGIDPDNFYTKEQMDEKLEDYAKSDEVYDKKEGVTIADNTVKVGDAEFSTTLDAGEIDVVSNHNVVMSVGDWGRVTFFGYDAEGNTDGTVTDFSAKEAKWVKNSIDKDFLDKSSKDVNKLSGKIQIGDENNSGITNAILHVRKVSGGITGKDWNGACFSVNGDGTATLQHKTYNSEALDGAKNAAVLRMSNQGLQFAVNTGSTASPAESDYKKVLLSGDTYTKVDTVYIGNSNVSVGTQQYNVGILNSAIVFSQNGENTLLTQPQVKWLSENYNNIYNKTEIDNKIGDIESLLSKI